MVSFLYRKTFENRSNPPGNLPVGRFDCHLRYPTDARGPQYVCRQDFGQHGHRGGRAEFSDGRSPSRQRARHTIIALDAIQRLTADYGNDLVDNNEIWISPIWNPDGYLRGWRRNLRPDGSVDLNRNYPFLWDSNCNTGVTGPGPGSEPKTQTMITLSEDQLFAKVLDFHRSGRESLYGYSSGCGQHALGAYLQAEATALSQASGYDGQVRGPSSDGEHYQWQLGVYSDYAFLTEIGNTLSRSIASTRSEATRVWPGTVWMLQRPIPVRGHVTDATSGAPVEGNISYVENQFTQGETNRSEPSFGRYHAFLPNGQHTLRFSHPCYITQNVTVMVTAGGIQIDVALTRIPGLITASATIHNPSHDGVSDLFKDAFGTDKNAKDSGGRPKANTVIDGGQPFLAVESSVPDGGRINTQNEIAAGDFVYGIELSEDLSNWRSAGLEIVISTGAPANGRVPLIARLGQFFLNVTGSCYMRVNVRRN